MDTKMVSRCDAARITIKNPAEAGFFIFSEANEISRKARNDGNLLLFYF
jgi:hypothetical protein